MRHTDLIGAETQEWRLVGHLVQKLFTIGIPAALQSTIVSFSMVVVASLVNTFGATVVAAFGAAEPPGPVRLLAGHVHRPGRQRL